MSHLSTHILDSTAGTPATDVGVVLVGPDGREIARGVTDADGRLSIGPETLDAGDYTLTFATGRYFATRGAATFYPSVSVEFTVSDAPHYHVPLLLSPFGYSTYRGT